MLSSPAGLAGLFLTDEIIHKVDKRKLTGTTATFCLLSFSHPLNDSNMGKTKRRTEDIQEGGELERKSLSLHVRSRYLGMRSALSAHHRAEQEWQE